MHAQKTLRVRAHGCRAVPLVSKRARFGSLARAQAINLPSLSLSPPQLLPPPPLSSPHSRLPSTAAAAAVIAAAAPTPQEAVDILFAGYSDIAERLQQAHTRIEHLERQQQQQPTTTPLAARTPWDAALFLLFFLAFINLAGCVALWQAQSAIAAAAAASGAPWWAALAPGGGAGAGLALAAGRGAAAAATSPPLLALALKRIVLFFVPLTNTAVVLTFCAAAVRAALSCLRAWQ